MANATVEKLKALGLRQGEKLVVGIAAAILLVCLGLFVTKPTIATNPAELQKKAEDADSNLNRRQDPEAILTRIEEAGIKDPGFVKIVESQSANALKPGDYRARLDWVTPEPGAGLIRDQPELIAPTELAAFPGRGGVLLYKLDEKDHRIVDTSATASGNQGGRRSGASSPTKAEDVKKRLDVEAQRKKRLLAGTAEKAKEKEETKAEVAEANPDDNGPWKEETQGKRWVVITAVVDNEQMNKNWLAALKNPSIAYPQYLQVDAQRQTLQDDGKWTEWAAVDEDAKYRVIDNLPEKDDEFVPESKRPESLVDPLPFLRAGYWTGVHVASLVPPDLLKAPDANVGGNFEGGRGSFNSGMSGRGGKAGMMAAMGGPENVTSGMGRMSGGMSGGGGTSASDETVVANSEAKLMIRWLDFSVEPNVTFRYRIRLVVKNPNYDHADVNPGTDTTSEKLTGPWSEPSIAVTVPADVSTYAQQAAPDNRRDDVVMFEVVRWNPVTGQTVVKTDDASPGFLIGEYGAVLEPTSEGGGAKNVPIDFNSRSFLLDAQGGRIRIPDIGLERTTFDIPVVAMVVEPDGAVVVRNQAIDNADEIRQDMRSNYKQALEDSGTKREKSNSKKRPVGLGVGSSKKSRGKGSQAGMAR